jgi:CIC family chloride channel protein
MDQEPKIASHPDEGPGNLVVLGLIAILAGMVSGFVGAVFRMTLVQVDYLRGALIDWAHGEKLAGFFLVIGATTAATAIAAWLVRRFSPEATGSGIPNVEVVLRGELRPSPFRLIPVKFLGGFLAIGGGLALGREGPTVQMGASLSYLVGRLCRRTWPDCRVLMAAGAGAGLATAFNAPIAGAVFVLEELVRRFETGIAIAALGASAGAIVVARVFLGSGPDFQVAAVPYLGFGTVVIHLALGIIAGLLGILYNRAILGALSVANRFRRWPVELRAGIIGAGVGLVGWFAPGLIGGGDNITQNMLTWTGGMSIVFLIFLLRFGFGPVSYAAGTPGGLFAPLLVPGAQIGLLFGLLCSHWLPGMTMEPRALAVVGMAAFFTAVVRAPLTGIILAIELTASFTLLLPMISACTTAMLVPTLLGDPPIYESLGEPIFRTKAIDTDSD